MDLTPQDALMVVDVQVDFCPGGALAVSNGHTVVPVLNRWLTPFAAAGRPIKIEKRSREAVFCLVRSVP